MIVEVPVVLLKLFIFWEVTARKQSVTSQLKLKERQVNKGGGDTFLKKIQFIHQTTYFPDGILRHNCSTLHGGKRKKNVKKISRFPFGSATFFLLRQCIMALILSRRDRNEGVSDQKLPQEELVNKKLPNNGENHLYAAIKPPKRGETSQIL